MPAYTQKPPMICIMPPAGETNSFTGGPTVRIPARLAQALEHVRMVFRTGSTARAREHCSETRPVR